MPTTLNEAEKILNISKKYLTPLQLKNLFKELYEKVGVETTNSSLKISLEMMNQLGEYAYQQQNKDSC